VPSNPDLTFEGMKKDLINRYVTQKRRSLPSLLSHLVRLTAYFGGRRARSITAADVRAYTTMRLHNDHAKPATVNRELAKLKAMFSNAMKTATSTTCRKSSCSMKVNMSVLVFFKARNFDAILEVLPILRTENRPS
jgi:hypothetical protein